MNPCSAEDFFTMFARPIARAEARHYPGMPAFIKQRVEQGIAQAMTDGVDGLVLELRPGIPDLQLELLVWFGVTLKHDGKFIYRVDPFLTEVGQAVKAKRIRMFTARAAYRRRGHDFLASGRWKEAQVCYERTL